MAELDDSTAELTAPPPATTAPHSGAAPAPNEAPNEIPREAPTEPTSEAHSAPSSEPSDELSAAQVAAYLESHPNFLEHHPELLETLELSHSAGAAVSLIERQVELLRVRNRRLEDRLERLIETARDNERRATHVHHLARALLRAPSMAAISSALRQRMREDFNIDECFIGLNPALFSRRDIEGLWPLDVDGTIARAYDDFLRTRLIECGPIDAERVKLLFGRNSTQAPAADGTPPPAIVSAAIVPLEKERSLGMLALGSREAERFQPRQGKLFLEMVAELLSAAIRSRLS